ncbi:MAG: outer membrane beta-barrel protein [Candidatus Krumholzibacteriia bacterium]
MQRNGNGWRRNATRSCALAAGLMVGLVGLVGLAGDATAAGQTGNYIALKGGIYSPSREFDLGNVNVDETFGADTETGFAGEFAFGRYFSPSFALELGLGYFKSNGTVMDLTEARGDLYDLDFHVVPLILSAKVFVPVGPVFPYGEFGVGAYFSAFDVSDNANSFEGTTTFGVHAGAGINVDVSSRVFVGVEARYVWNDPDFGGQQINLNGEDYALDGFKLNGFTTMLVLGLGF